MKAFTFCPWCGKELVNREVDGIVRKVCPDSTCGFGTGLVVKKWLARQATLSIPSP